MSANHNHIRSVLVVGAGLMGTGIAQLFASRGYQVALTDVNEKIPSDALVNIRHSLERMAEQGLTETSGM